MVIHCGYARREDRRRLLADHVRPVATPGFWFHDLPLNDTPGFELVWPGEVLFALEPWMSVVRREVPAVPHEGEAYQKILVVDSAIALETLDSPHHNLDVFYAVLDPQAAPHLWKWLASVRLGRQDFDTLSVQLAGSAIVSRPPGPRSETYIRNLEPYSGLLSPMELARLAHAQWVRLYGPETDPWPEIITAYRNSVIVDKSSA